MGTNEEKWSSDILLSTTEVSRGRSRLYIYINKQSNGRIKLPPTQNVKFISHGASPAAPVNNLSKAAMVISNS
jgi:hypothetical protein